jgi:hypothetical protein
MLLHKQWNYSCDLCHVLPDCILIFDTWFSGFRVLNTQAESGTKPYISPAAAQRAYGRGEVVSVTRLKIELAQSQAGRQAAIVPVRATPRARIGQARIEHIRD